MTLATPEALAVFLRRDKDVLLAAWETRAQQLSLPADTPAPILRDHVPRLLDTLAEALSRPGGAARARPPSAAHGANRRRLGMPLTEIVEEYRLLRDVIIERAQADGMLIAGETSRALNDLIDEGIKAAIHTYIEQRNQAEGQRRNEYLKFIVHDLRSPLSAIYYAILLAEKDLAQVPVAARVREIHAAIKRNVERMRGLIVKLLQEEDNLQTPRDVKAQLAALEVRPVIESAARALASLAAAGDTEVLNQVPAGLRARADAELLRRIVQNLLANAIDHAPKGRVIVGAAAAGGRVQCWVGDNGRGMSPELVQSLREPDAAGPESERSRLGLAVAQRLVRAHGGSIEIDSEPGTTIRFSLPSA